MSPRLIALTGPLEGRTLEIGDGETFSVGRHSSSSVQLRDLAVSRHHCELRPAGGGLVLADLGSRHGTRINGVPVTERPLVHGDLIQIGSSRLLFLTEAVETAEGEDAALWDDSELIADSTLHLPVDEIDPKRPLTALGSLAGTGAAAQRLSSLLAAAAELPGLAGVEAVARRAVEAAFELTPAERVAMVQKGRGEDLEWLHGADRRRPSRRPTISRTIARRVLAENRGVVLTDVLQAAAAGGAESLSAERIASLACVPLPATEGTAGLLYADTRDPEVRFGEEHLRLLTALAALAAPALAGARRLERSEAERRRLQEAQLAHDMIGESPAMERVLDFLARAAPTDSTVLLTGASGTGKELAARALHANSARSGGPFVAINCATLSEALLASELFGHEKGAFTGAVARKLGKLEVADGGTVFLDEIGEIPLALQAQLLRVLEQRELERVGGTRPIPVDVRVVAATNRDLEKAVAEGSFRGDLYYRLNVLAVRLPPLTRRRGDVSILARHFATVHAHMLHRPPPEISPAAEAALATYDWPGNVRELANAIERAVVLGSGEEIRLEDLPEAIVEGRTDTGGPAASYHDVLTEAKKRLIRDALADAGGNVTAAARALDLHPNYLHRLITKLGLRDGPRPED